MKPPVSLVTASRHLVLLMIGDFVCYNEFCDYLFSEPQFSIDTADKSLALGQRFPLVPYVFQRCPFLMQCKLYQNVSFRKIFSCCLILRFCLTLNSPFRDCNRR